MYYCTICEQTSREARGKFLPNSEYFQHPTQQFWHASEIAREMIKPEAGYFFPQNKSKRDGDRLE